MSAIFLFGIATNFLWFEVILDNYHRVVANQEKPFNSAYCVMYATTPAWSDGYNPVGVLSVGLSPMTSV